MNRNEKDLREASGSINYSDPLTSFLYQLIRDELPAGVVEKIVRDVVNEPEECLYTNGWLAQYANNLSEELKNASANKLRKALNVAFNGNVKKENIKDKQKITSSSDSYTGNDLSLMDKDFTALEEKIRNESNIEEEIDNENEDPAVDDAKDAVQQMVEHGHISKEEGESLKQEIDGVVVNKQSDTGYIPDTVKQHFNKPQSERFVTPSSAFQRINISAVEVKSEAEKEKLTTDEAKDMVETAVEESETIKDMPRVNVKYGVNKLNSTTKEQNIVQSKISFTQALEVSSSLYNVYGGKSWCSCIEVIEHEHGGYYVLVGVVPEEFEEVRKQHDDEMISGVLVRFESCEMATALANNNVKEENEE